MFGDFTVQPIKLSHYHWLPSSLYSPAVVLDKESVKQHVRQLQTRFRDLVISTYRILIYKHVDVDLRGFRVSLLALDVFQKHEHRQFINDHLMKIDPATTFDDLWAKLNNYWNFLNFDLLEHIVSIFGSEDLKQKMESYEHDLQSFRKSTRLCDFIHCWPVQGQTPPETELREFIMKVGHQWESCTLEDLESLKGVITHKFLLPEFTLRLREIMKGTLEIEHQELCTSDSTKQRSGPTRSHNLEDQDHTHLAGSIPGVEMVGEVDFIVPTQGGSFQWKGYGLKIHAPKDGIPAKCRIKIKVSLSGQFQLPEDSELLSPVFWISAPCKFTKPVTLEIQHCALTEDEAVLSNLSFVLTKCTQRDLPYRFRQVNGGVFTTNSMYGSIQLNHFSGFGVTGRKGTPRSYCAYVYHTKKRDYEWRFYFVIIQDLEAKNKVNFC